MHYANSADPWHFIAIGSFYILEGDRLLSETPIVVIRRNVSVPTQGTRVTSVTETFPFVVTPSYVG